MTDQADEDFAFRAVLIKIQHSLSDDDRRQLNFLFGEDIPRCLQSNGSIEASLSALQTLFDRLKISSNNYTYLVRALQAIQREDCVERLLNYHKIVPDEVIPRYPKQPQEEEESNNTLPFPSHTHPTAQEILNDIAEDDVMCLEKPQVETVRVHLPEPDPIDFNSIDLGPFEHSSHEWTEEYSKLLNLKYHPRGYQIEIIRNAVNNGNTIICLRTGSGKTFIGSLLIKYYFIKHQKANPDEKFSTVFLVPRKAIRAQQAKAISDVGNIKVKICEDDQTIDQLIENTHVIVATPQKLVNCLNKGTVLLSQINLMVFDECHNTSGGNPYSEIMKHYLCPSKKQQDSTKPLIIGLTATISAKDASEKKEDVKKNLVSLCSRLACNNISTVCDKNNIDEMNREVSRPINNQFEHIKKTKYNECFLEYLAIYDNLIKTIKRHLDGHELLNDQITGSSGFVGQLVLLKQSFEKKGDLNNVIICDYLLLLTKKYSAFKDLPFDMVTQYILQQIQWYHKRYQLPVPMDNFLYEFCKIELNKILEKYKEHPTTNSKLEMLIDFLTKHSRGEAKGLILVQTTFYAKALCDYLSSHPDLKNLIKSTWIVGQSSPDHSLTINEQQKRLKQFCEDECNLLISTDIVQEGLDIPTCSYVIRYEFVSDEIGTIQSRGRARARDSSYYLITEDGSINHKREQHNKFREYEMEQVISEWPSIDKERFQHDVEVKRKAIISEWENDIMRETQRRSKLRKIGKKDGFVCCRKCSRKLGELAWLKKRNVCYFINNPEFFDTNKCKLESEYDIYQEIMVLGEVTCKCGNALGGYQKFIDRPDLRTMCALKCKQIKFSLNGQTGFIEFQQWRKNDSFDVEELEEI